MKTFGYILWLFGFTGSHRFYYGRPITGAIWFFTFGLLMIGWIVDLFLIPSMDRQADLRFAPGKIDYNIACTWESGSPALSTCSPEGFLPWAIFTYFWVKI